MATSPTTSWFHSPAMVSGDPSLPRPDIDLDKRVRQEQFLQLARERFEMARIAEDTRRSEMLQDLKFRLGEQWDQTIKLKREQQGRPCLTINRIPGFLKHVTNAMRQARPEIKVDPVGEGADEEIAEIRQGLIRHILMNSHFEVPADTSFEQMATMGLGWMRVVDAWEGFNKELFVEWIPNPFCVYSDPTARRPDWSDAKWRFIVGDYTLAEFRDKFGEKDEDGNYRVACGLDGFKSIGDHSKNWLINGKVRVAEYFHIEEEDDVLCQLPDGSEQLLSEMDEKLLDSVVQTRPEKVPHVVWSLIDGVEVLKERKWKGKYIPVIPVIGNQIEYDGDLILVGMVRYARESQRMYNYAYSCFVEAIALAPKAPFIAEFDQISEFKATWEAANTDPVAVLPYRHVDSSSGQPIPMPQRQQAEPPVAAFGNLLTIADQNLKATFSIYEAALGERGPQESGVAINSRKLETDVATYDWIDNFTRALRFLGLVLNDLLPHYYNEKGRIVQITREDLTSEPITMNQIDKDGNIYDLSKGKFAITISTGPSHNTRRQEAAQAMLEVAKVYPPLWQAAGPRMIRAMDWPQKEAIAAQLEKLQPPELRESKKGDENQPDAGQLQQQLQQMQAMVQQLTQALHGATDAREAEAFKEANANYRVQLQQEVALATAEMKAGIEQSKFLNQELFKEFERIRAVLEGQQQSPKAGAPAAQPGGAPQGPGGPPAAAPAPQVPPQGENTPSGVGTAQP